MIAKPVSWNGIHYPSIKACANDNDKLYITMVARLNKGNVCDADVRAVGGSQKTPCIWNGTAYKSLSAAANESDYSRNTIRKYMKLGYANDADIKVEIMKLERLHHAFYT